MRLRTGFVQDVRVIRDIRVIGISMIDKTKTIKRTSSLTSAGGSLITLGSFGVAAT
jgi:hypothetical protein